MGGCYGQAQISQVFYFFHSLMQYLPLVFNDYNFMATKLNETLLDCILEVRGSRMNHVGFRADAKGLQFCFACKEIGACAALLGVTHCGSW